MIRRLSLSQRLALVVVSLLTRPSAIEQVQAGLFIPATTAAPLPTFRRWRSAVTVELPYRTMVRLGLYAAQRSASVSGSRAR